MPCRHQPAQMSFSSVLLEEYCPTHHVFLGGSRLSTSQEAGHEPRGAHGSMDQGRPHRDEPHVLGPAWRHQARSQSGRQGAGQLRASLGSGGRFSMRARIKVPTWRLFVMIWIVGGRLGQRLNATYNGGTNCSLT